MNSYKVQVNINISSTAYLHVHYLHVKLIKKKREVISVRDFIIKDRFYSQVEAFHLLASPGNSAHKNYEHNQWQRAGLIVINAD